MTDVPLVPTFKHRGDAGDIFYSLPTIKAIVKNGAGTGALYLCPEHGARQAMTPMAAANLAALLKYQPYLSRVAFAEAGTKVDYNLIDFRDYWINNPVHQRSIAEYHAVCFGVPLPVDDEPWLMIPDDLKLKGFGVVVNRSTRYHNDKFPWQRIAEKYKHNAVFVGLPDEHAEFVVRYNWPIPRMATRNWLDIARLIESCQLFIGNQSGPLAIAQGLKKSIILECWLTDVNVGVDKPNVIYGYDDSFELPEL